MALAIFLATGVTMQAQDRLTQYKSGMPSAFVPPL